MARRRPAETRTVILDAAFWEMYKNGYQGASIDRVLEGTSMTKGALFHHFPNKQQLGYAVVEGPVQRWVHEHWIAPLSRYSDTLLGVSSALQAYLENSPEEVICGGCPLNNLTQEMSGIDEGMRLRLDRVGAEWRGAVADRWRQDQAAGLVQPDPGAEAVAGWLVASIQGILGSAKAAKGRAPAERARLTLFAIADSLRVSS